MRAAILTLTLVLLAPPVLARDIHEERSLYRNIVVSEQDGRRCLLFTVRKGNHNQSCMELAHPKRLVFAYTRMTMAGLLLNPLPRHILVIGLGGGSVPRALSELYPDATVTVVEIDEAVERVAKKYFDFKESDRMKVNIADARVFVKRAGLRGAHYDFIMLDAFNGDYIPEHLMTREFLQEVKAILDKDGVLVANTFSTSSLYDHESETYKAVFGKFYNFKLPITGNRVIVAVNGKLPDDSLLWKRAAVLESRLKPYGVDLKTYPPHMSLEEDWDSSARPLTDQYSPANLLQGK